MDLDGAITFSRIGGDSHEGETKQITELLKVQNVEINSIEEIHERFIDLNSLNFRNLPNKVSSLSEIQLRLELFLDKTEGALVYIQNNPIGEFHSDNTIIRLITPNTTDAHQSQERFSLTYIFEHTFGKIPEYKNGRLFLEEINADFKAVLKILTFKRKESNIGVYMKKASKNLGNLPVELAPRD